MLPELKKVHSLLFKEYPELKLDFHQEMAKITNDLLDQGWNIDSVSNKRFNSIFNEHYNEYFQRTFQEKQKTDKKRNPSPELQEVFSEFQDRILQILMKVTKQLQNDIERLKKTMEIKKK